MYWERMLPSIIATRSWKNGYLNHLAEAIFNGEDPTPYIESAWLKKEGLCKWATK